MDTNQSPDLSKIDVRKLNIICKFKKTEFEIEKKRYLEARRAGYSTCIVEYLGLIDVEKQYKAVIDALKKVVLGGIDVDSDFPSLDEVRDYLDELNFEEIQIIGAFEDATLLVYENFEIMPLTAFINFYTKKKGIPSIQISRWYTGEQGAIVRADKRNEKWKYTVAVVDRHEEATLPSICNPGDTLGQHYTALHLQMDLDMLMVLNLQILGLAQDSPQLTDREADIALPGEEIHPSTENSRLRFAIYGGRDNTIYFNDVNIEELIDHQIRPAMLIKKIEG